MGRNEMNAPSRMRAATTTMLAAFALMLTGCLVTPGKFESQLVLKNDGTFSFNYDGEIFFLGLSKLAQMGAASEEFEAESCFDDNFDIRECSEEELADQRAQWETQAEERAEKARKDAAEMAQLMGGIDPTDPEATEDLRKLLLRHKGWNRVESKGDGLFEVSYAVEGALSHDFMFPVIEGFPTANIFVQTVLRNGNTVRVNAPGLSAENDTNPMGAMMGGMAGLANLGNMGGNDNADEMPDMPSLDGTFRIITDGEILANNTDEGAEEALTGWKTLNWKIDSRTKAEPTALIRLNR